MSAGWAHSDAEAETAHGKVTASCVVAWVRCDRCGEHVATVGVPADSGGGIVAELADAEGYERCESEDLCPACVGGIR